MENQRKVPGLGNVGGWRLEAGYGSQCSLQQGKYLAAAAGYTCPQTVRGLLGGTEGRNVNFEEVAADALLPGQLSCTLPWPDFPPPLSLWV